MPLHKTYSRKLSQVYGERVKVLGIYLWKKTGRKIVDVHTSTKKKTCQLARIKLEIKLGRKLKTWETVDHVDEDCTNDRYVNLEVLSLKKNSAKSAWKVKEVEQPCLQCGKNVTLTRAQMDGRKAGPFCSRSCSGKYGARVSQGKQKRKPNKVTRTYYQ